MKYFLSAITIRQGDQEYGEHLLVRAANDADAKRQTEDWLLDVYCDDRSESGRMMSLICLNR